MKVRAWLTAVVFLTSFTARSQAGPERPILSEGAMRLGSTGLRHPDPICAIAFSPDGKLLATADHQGRVRLWDAATGELRHDFPKLTGTVFAFSPDGKYLATAGPGNDHVKQLRIWSVTDGKVREGVQKDWWGPLCFTPDSLSLVCSNSNDAVLISAETGKEIRQFKGLPRRPYSMTVSRDGKWVAASANEDHGPVIVWDAATCKERASFNAKDGWISLTFSPDGTKLATASPHATNFWDPATGKHLGNIGNGATNDVAFDKSGQWVVTAGNIVLFDVKKNKIIHQFGKDQIAEKVAISPDGTRIASPAFNPNVVRLSVNYHTLADFRVDPPQLLDRLLTHSVAVLREQGLVDLNRVAHDGMRVRGSAGAASFHRRATLEQHLLEAQEQIQRLKQELTDDPNRISRRKGSARQRAARERAERVQQALKRLPELEAQKTPAEKDQARASCTDPQATVMKMADGGFRPAYNIQCTADCPSQVIVAVEVSTSGSDMGQLKPAIEQVHTRLGVAPREVLADGGFAKHEDIEEIEKSGGCQVYIPVPKPRVAGVDPHAPHKGDSEGIIRWRARMGREEAKAISKDRGSVVECVNAHNSNRGLVRLRVRGQPKVKSIALWFAIVQNVACGVRLRALAALAV